MRCTWSHYARLIVEGPESLRSSSSRKRSASVRTLPATLAGRHGTHGTFYMWWHAATHDFPSSRVRRPQSRFLLPFSYSVRELDVCVCNKRSPRLVSRGMHHCVYRGVLPHIFDILLTRLVTRISRGFDVRCFSRGGVWCRIKVSCLALLVAVALPASIFG